MEEDRVGGAILCRKLCWGLEGLDGMLLPLLLVCREWASMGISRGLLLGSLQGGQHGLELYSAQAIKAVSTRCVPDVGHVKSCSRLPRGGPGPPRMRAVKSGHADGGTWNQLCYPTSKHYNLVGSQTAACMWERGG